MHGFILVALGGAIGAAARHAVNLASFRISGPQFPWGTVFVNISGSFLMGIAADLMLRRYGGSEPLRLFIATGILGGFTTFSAFSFEFAALAERGLAASAAFYALGNVVGSVAALFLGLWLARAVL